MTVRSFSVICLVLFSFFILSACSGGSHTPQAPLITFPSGGEVFVKGQAITSFSPVNTGGPVASYSVSPALPAGLSLNTTTGLVSGTPTTVVDSTTFVFTATNAGGSSTASFVITVHDLPPGNFTYAASPAIFVQGTAASDAVTFTSTGGAVTSFTVTPSLPNGLQMDPQTGLISGTPSLQATQRAYYVSANNSGGTTTAMLIITIWPIAPSIVFQPRDQHVSAGLRAYFQLSTVGGETATQGNSFSWYRNGSLLTDGTMGFVYQTPTLSLTDNGAKFQVVVTDPFGRSVTSDVATLTVSEPLGHFVDTGMMNTERAYHTSTLLPNGRVLVAGGKYGSNCLQTAELYDPDTGEFEFLTSVMEKPQCGHSATLLPNGKVLIVGTNPPQLYDPATQSFSSTASPVPNIYYTNSTLLDDGRVLLSGCALVANLCTLVTNIYDPASGTFSSSGTANVFHSMPPVKLHNGLVLFAGTANTGTSELYDPATETFSYTGSLQKLTVVSTVLLNDGRVYAVGIVPTTSGQLTYLPKAEIYDPASGTFSEVAAPIVVGSQPTLMNNGQVLMLSYNYQGSLLNQTEVEIYDPVQNSYRLDAISNRDLYYSTVNLLPNGQFFFVGSHTPSQGGPSKPAQLYVPAAQ